ncbi:hypothetical protein [Patulibacter sp.]|uniref:hypothetical protein n=1 Tax=Patulibacter sp. TaxID=1912859 RepID=UPI00271C37B4|nr:hypothetical protein [Patulibacter sp.]MDO9409377.1 hypothetical protein [Patulibacter sp.]
MPQDTDSTLSARDLDRVIAARQRLRSYAPYSPTAPPRPARRTSRVRPLVRHPSDERPDDD